MPIEYDIKDEVIEIRLRGQVTTADFEAYLRSSEIDSRYDARFPRLIVIDPDASFPSSAEIAAGARQTSKRAVGSARFACVATTPLAIGISSMFMGYAGVSDSFQIFADVGAARIWLKTGA